MAHLEPCKDMEISQLTYHLIFYTMSLADIDIYRLAKKVNEIVRAEIVVLEVSNKLFFVKSTSDTHHSIQCLTNERTDCDKLGMALK